MSSLFYYFLIAIGLSMDSFSLSIIYGLNMRQKMRIITSLTVGLFHYMMPTVGAYLSKMLLVDFNKYTNIISGLIFTILSVSLIYSYNKEEQEIYSLSKLYTIILFAFGVSIDSFSIGIVLSLSKENILCASIIFAIVSSSITYFGLLIGKIINQKAGNISKIIGIVILVLLSIKYFLNI